MTEDSESRVDTRDSTAWAEPWAAPPQEFQFSPRPKFQDRRWLHLLLLILTIGSTTLAGAGWYQSFNLEFLPGRPQSSFLALALNGFWYSGTILAILGCHELGHYLACRYYDVDASLPFFIPMPLLLTGTLGAFIRIREPIPTKRKLFDIGIAGPIAGFVVAVPALFIGIALSRMDPPLSPADLPDTVTSFTMGEPLLFKAVAWLIHGSPPGDQTLTLHPMAFAAWFGLLATALNLFPVGQLDGGHISYAVLGRKSSHVTLATLGAAIVLTFFSTSWIVWTGLMIVMLMKFGRHHPPTYDEDEPIDRTRLILALVALVMLIICFTPAPMNLIER